MSGEKNHIDKRVVVINEWINSGKTNSQDSDLSGFNPLVNRCSLPPR